MFFPVDARNFSYVACRDHRPFVLLCLEKVDLLIALRHFLMMLLRPPRDLVMATCNKSGSAFASTLSSLIPACLPVNITPDRTSCNAGLDRQFDPRYNCRVEVFGVGTLTRVHIVW
jgi:hypothetical protein